MNLIKVVIPNSFQLYLNMEIDETNAEDDYEDIPSLVFSQTICDVPENKAQT